ncbi:MAG: exonuclease SbcCD subunit D C-terminal domain-containing protein [Thermoanaerobaculia bacterium]|nr:exonuclease SbcCD subunit D C-terminal domain-containing protein [Thermoanaerobaculia bacterium]
MRLLHTADWHVGRTIRGRSRVEEHRRVLAEIVEITAEHEVDVVVVAGDLFDAAAPTAEAEEVVYASLLDLTDQGADVVVVAGNHDNPRRFEAIRPLLARTGRVWAAGEIARPDEGGVVTIEPRRAGGERVRVALFPFLTLRRVLSAARLMEGGADLAIGDYASRCDGIVQTLCADLSGDTVNVLVAHLMTAGAVAGGGERPAHMIDDYWVPPSVFRHPHLQYVALGHVHRQQPVPAPCPAWYAGAPLQLDFGEEEHRCGVILVDVEPGAAGRVETVPLAAGRRLRTLAGSLDSLVTHGAAVGDEYLRIRVEERPRPGLADEVRDIFPNAVEIQLADPDEPGPSGDDTVERLRTAPREIFAEYLAEQGAEDEDVLALFDELLESLHEA